MDEKNEFDKVEDVMLPGFRFHPTDEELVGFYLCRKIQNRPLPIELIKQVDIYKYEPWDLPKLAATGEKEWYFYCPRDRKYRNSARPNRVTGAGFWKATGTDRPIYSSDGSKCIGLKKSLVFYRGRAAKGMKTDWMMHEFRLPSLSYSAPPKKLLDKSLPANDAWAICRIFKKTNSLAQRALSHSWMSQFPEASASDILNQDQACARFNSESLSSTTEIGSALQLCSSGDLQQASTASFSSLDIPSFKPFIPAISKSPLFSVSNGELPINFTFSQNIDAPSQLLNSSLIEGQPQQQFSGFTSSFAQDMRCRTGVAENEAGTRKNNPGSGQENGQPEMLIRSMGFPFSLPADLPDAWRPNLPWDSPTCPSEMSTTYSPNKSFT